jgi:predicted enzyme related to lactoylglutathione lyase
MKLIVNIDVPSLLTAIDFYSLAFGLTHTRTLDSDVAELTGGSTTFYLLQKATGSAAHGGTDPGRDYRRHWTPVHFDVVVADLDAAIERAVAAGARAETDVVAWRGSRCVTFADPFGHGFCLIEFANGETYHDAP